MDEISMDVTEVDALEVLDLLVDLLVELHVDEGWVVGVCHSSSRCLAHDEVIVIIIIDIEHARHWVGDVFILILQYFKTLEEPGTVGSTPVGGETYLVAVVELTYGIAVADGGEVVVVAGAEEDNTVASWLLIESRVA